jgi:hypothetical protein
MKMIIDFYEFENYSLQHFYKLKDLQSSLHHISIAMKVNEKKIKEAQKRLENSILNPNQI